MIDKVFLLGQKNLLIHCQESLARCTRFIYAIHIENLRIRSDILVSSLFLIKFIHACKEISNLRNISTEITCIGIDNGMPNIWPWIIFFLVEIFIPLGVPIPKKMWLIKISIGIERKEILIIFMNNWQRNMTDEDSPYKFLSFFAMIRDA